jgi:hypothetical protein
LGTSGAALGAGFEKEPPRDILGVSIGMKAADARRRLEKLGRLEKSERKQQEVWAVHDGRFSHLIVGFSKDASEVRFITAKARPGGPRIRYSDIGDTRKAKVAVAPPNHEYSWAVTRRNGRPGYLVVARGANPDFLLYLSMKKAD